MDAFGDSGELYSIRNEFFTGQFSRVCKYHVEDFLPENRLKALEYKIRAYIELGEDASGLIEDAKTAYPELEQFFQLLGAYNDLLSFAVDDSPYFEDVKVARNELQAVLTAIYDVKYKRDIDLAINLLNTYIDSIKVPELEPFLILVQLYLIEGNETGAIKTFHKFQNFPDYARDSIIYQLIDTWIMSLRGLSDTINNAYYFYDEWLANDGGNPLNRLSMLKSLFTLTLQLRHYPEAEEILSQIKAIEEADDPDVLANQITFSVLTNKDPDNLIEELRQMDPEHPFIIDLNEKNTRFDEIAEKYSSL